MSDTPVADPTRRSDGSFSIGSDVWPGLSKAIEEAGEFLQVCGKIIATHGDPSHWDGTDLRDRFLEEAADLRAAIDFVLAMNFTGEQMVETAERTSYKFGLFLKWQNEQVPVPDPSPS